MTAVFIVAGMIWGVVLVVSRRRARRRANVLIGAGSERDDRTRGGF